MRKTSLTIIFTVLLIISPSFHTTSFAEKPNNNYSNSDSPIIDLFRILKIDFETPDLIQDCGSMFFLKINVTKIKFLNSPMLFSITVLLKTKDDYGRNIINFIGSEPFIYLPYYITSKTITMPCFTNKNFTNNLYRLNSQAKHPIEIYEGSIGVRIERFPRWFSDGLIGFIGKRNFFQKTWESLMNYFWIQTYQSLSIETNGNNKILQDITLDNNIFYKQRFKTLYRLFSIFNILISNMINTNRCIIWKDVNLIRPFVCSDDISISSSYVIIDNKTDENGNFTAILKIVNNLKYDINVRGDVDILETPFINTIIPSIDTKFYNAGYFEDEIPKNDYVVKIINCSFPKDQIFQNKTYLIKLEFNPYLYVGNSNKFGFFFFDLRWKTYLEPKYHVNKTVTSSIKNMWYNVPIFYGESGEIDIFPYYYDEIQYIGPTPDDEFEEALDKISAEVNSWIQLYFLLSLIIIGFALIGYWFIRKKY